MPSTLFNLWLGLKRKDWKLKSTRGHFWASNNRKPFSGQNNSFVTSKPPLWTSRGKHTWAKCHSAGSCHLREIRFFLQNTQTWAWLWCILSIWTFLKIVVSREIQIRNTSITCFFILFGVFFGISINCSQLFRPRGAFVLTFASSNVMTFIMNREGGLVWCKNGYGEGKSNKNKLTDGIQSRRNPRLYIHVCWPEFWKLNKRVHLKALKDQRLDLLQKKLYRLKGHQEVSSLLIKQP